jgi:hypothetical protein
MTYRVVRDEGPQEPSDALEIEDEDSDTPSDDHGPSSDCAAPERAFQNDLPEPDGQPRVTYSGRLGTDPRTKVTPRGRYVMAFPVAVAVESQHKPEWRSTVVFDDKARQLDGMLSKGTVVDVVAYEHRKVSRDPKTGARRERMEYYATAVTPKLRKAAADRGARDGQRP